MYWNIRVVNCPSENGNEDLLCFKEVYYDDNDQPCSYGDPFICSETKEGLAEIIDRMHKAMSRETLHENQFNGESK